MTRQTPATPSPRASKAAAEPGQPIAGGGAMLTGLGREIIDRYRRVESRAAASSAADLKALSELLA